MKTAQCYCGSASIAVQGEPRLHAICHCTDCKRSSGSAFRISAYFLKSDVIESKGEMTVFSVERRGDEQDLFFCRVCGSTLYWHSAARPHLVGIAAGCFPDTSVGVPSVSAKTAEKLSWVTLPDSMKLL